MAWLRHSSRFHLVTSAGVLAALVAAACTDQTNPTAPVLPADEAGDDAAAAIETPAPSSSPEASVEGGPRSTTDGGLTGECADTFGDELTQGFGRIDGVVYAVQKPSDMHCTLPNSDHVVVQVLMRGKVYRMVVNVESDRPGQDPEVRYAAIPHALPAPAFSEGWHTDASLDYVDILGVHNDDFSPSPMDELVTKIDDELVIGAPVSVYAISGRNRPESAHLVHRNSRQGEDGAIVVSPTTSPKFLLFHFDGQVF